MRRALLALVPASTALAALLGAGLPQTAALLIAIIVGSLAAAVLHYAEQRHVDRVAREINSWLGPRGYAPLRAAGGTAWWHLALAVNALGAAHELRDDDLARERRLRDDLLEALPEPALLFGGNGRLAKANAAGRERYRLEPGAALTPAQTLGSADLGRAVGEARALRRRVAVEARLGDADLLAVAAPVGDDVLLQVFDRTEQRLVEEVRRDFVVNASHELKTPVAGIQALTDALDITLGRDESRSRALVSRLNEEVERLRALVRDLLDLRRLEDGASSQTAPVDLAALVRAEAGRIQTGASQRQIAVETRLPQRAIVAGSEEDLRLIVANLLDNAVGYNRTGGNVRIRLVRGDACWRLEVRDTGIGIPRQDLDRIFERFYRVDVDRSRARGGTGLGLSLVRHAVERHGGNVTVDSTLGEGTVFRVELPVA